MIDNVDPSHTERDPADSQLTFLSPGTDLSYVSVPLRKK